MPSFFEQIKQRGELEEGSFGHKPRDRDTPIQHSEFYKKLPVDDKELVEAVRQGKENAALIYFDGDFLLFEHKEGGIACSNGKKVGYQVYHCPENKQIFSKKTLQSSASQLQFFNNLQSSLSLLLMVIILIGGVFLVYKIDNIGTPLNNQDIADKIADKVNINEVGELIATKLSQPSYFIDKLATKAANKMPEIKSQEVTDAIATNLANTHGQAVKQIVTGDKIVTELVNKLYAENQKTWIEQLKTLNVSKIAKLVAEKIGLEGNQTIVVKDVVEAIKIKLVEQFNRQIDTEQFRIALELAGQFEDIDDDGTWKKLKLGSKTAKFLSCPNEGNGKGNWDEPTYYSYDQYDNEMFYCKNDGRSGYLYKSITFKSLEQFGITIDEKGNLYYSPK